MADWLWASVPGPVPVPVNPAFSMASLSWSLHKLTTVQISFNSVRFCAYENRGHYWTQTCRPWTLQNSFELCQWPRHEVIFEWYAEPLLGTAPYSNWGWRPPRLSRWPRCRPSLPGDPWLVWERPDRCRPDAWDRPCRSSTPSWVLLRRWSIKWNYLSFKDAYFRPTYGAPWMKPTHHS